MEAIHSAAAVGARTIGEEGAMGTIETGKLANFVILARDPIADIANIRTVTLIVKRGERFSRSDYRPVTAEEMGQADKP